MLQKNRLGRGKHKTVTYLMLRHTMDRPNSEGDDQAGKEKEVQVREWMDGAREKKETRFKGPP